MSSSISASTVFAKGTLIRFAPGTEYKRTAVVLGDGSFLEVKAPGLKTGEKRAFANGDAWSASFMGEGATLADVISNGKITVENRQQQKIRQAEEAVANVPKDIQRLHQLHPMFGLRPTLKYKLLHYGTYVNGRYNYIWKQNYKIQSNSESAIFVMDKYGGLHHIGFTPYKGGLLAIGGYMSKEDKTLHKTAQRFCDISDDFTEDAPLYMYIKSDYGAGGSQYYMGDMYRISVDGFPMSDKTKKFIYLPKARAVLNQIMIGRLGEREKEIVGLIRDAGYLLGCGNHFTLRKYFRKSFREALPPQVKIVDFGWPCNYKPMEFLTSAAKLAGVKIPENAPTDE